MKGVQTSGQQVKRAEEESDYNGGDPTFDCCRLLERPRPEEARVQGGGGGGVLLRFVVTIIISIMSTKH